MVVINEKKKEKDEEKKIELPKKCRKLKKYECFFCFHFFHKSFCLTTKKKAENIYEEKSCSKIRQTKSVSFLFFFCLKL